MAMVDPTVAGLASVHGCIGAVDPVRTFGNAEQKARFLPRLASGQKLSAFALTEPCAGSDLTALRTRSRARWAINMSSMAKNCSSPTSCRAARSAWCACIDRKPAVLIVDLPDAENEHFQLKKYGLYALKHTLQPAASSSAIFACRPPICCVPVRGDGLTIAYHGLNLGRIAPVRQCGRRDAGDAGQHDSLGPVPQNLRFAIASRELVRRRLGRLAGLIVAADALVEWCAGLIDQGYRGEMECIVAKVFGSEAQKEAAIELFMKTHGGRSFLHGHLFGDNVHEYLAPCIYEGEGEMLSMAFFKSLVKQHGVAVFRADRQGPASGRHSQAEPDEPGPRLGTQGRHRALRPVADGAESSRASVAGAAADARSPARRMPNLRPIGCSGMPLEISGTMSKHQLALADRQCRMSELS